MSFYDTFLSAVGLSPSDPSKKPSRSAMAQAISEIKTVTDAETTSRAAADVALLAQITATQALVTAGVQRKASVRVATTTAGTLATSYENGDTVDGIVLATNDDILIKDLVSGADNGIRTVQASGAPTRRADADTAGEIGYAAVYVREGTVNAGTTWTCQQAPGAITINTTPLTFALSGSEADLSPRLDDVEEVTDQFTATLTYDWEYAVQASTGSGEVLEGRRNGRTMHAGSWRDRLHKNEEFTRRALNQLMTKIASVIVGYNVILTYGQSTMQGAATCPPKSKVQSWGNLMLGNAARTQADATWTPIGGSNTLNPLIAVATDGAGAVLNAAAVTALLSSDQRVGESPVVGITNFFSILSRLRLQDPAESTRKYIGNDLSQGGRELAELEPSHTVGPTEWYGRIPAFLTASKGVATGLGKAHQVAAIGFAQGQTESLNVSTVTRNRSEYRILLANLIAAMQADAATYGGNTAPPGFFLFGTGESYTRNLDTYGFGDMFVQMALLEYAIEQPQFVFAVGPEYPYTDKSGQHQDANGARWKAMKMAQIMDRVINQRQSWLPLFPIATEILGDYLYVHFHVPRPPLKWGIAYYNGAAASPSNSGFKVSDSTGDLTLGAPEIAGPTTVRMKLNRLPFPHGKVWYAHEGVNGVGLLCDSDTFDTPFVYTTSTDPVDSVLISGLANLPYDMSNWCMPFVVPVEMERM